MDKITFESVMEEIKKSLGDARLKSIEEALDDENGARKDMPGFKPTPEPSANDLYKEPGSQANAPSTTAPPSTGTAVPPAPTPKPVDASTQGTIDRMSTPGNAPGSGTSSVRSGVGGGSAGLGLGGAQIGGKPVAPSTPITGPKPSVSAPAPAPRPTTGMTNQTAPRTSAPVAPTSSAPAARPSNFSTNNNSPYGYAKPGSDEDTPANFFASSDRQMAAQSKSAPPASAPRPSAPRPAPSRTVTKTAPSSGITGRNQDAALRTSAPRPTQFTENFDQFVKNFLKESK